RSNSGQLLGGPASDMQIAEQQQHAAQRFRKRDRESFHDGFTGQLKNHEQRQLLQHEPPPRPMTPLASASFTARLLLGSFGQRTTGKRKLITQAQVVLPRDVEPAGAAVLARAPQPE